MILKHSLSLVAVLAGTAAADPAPAEREAAFRTEAIRFAEVGVLASDGIEPPSAITVIYRGDRRISLAELYETVERPDLARRLVRRRNFGIGAAAIGGVAVLGATLLFATKGIAGAMPDDAEEDDARKWRSVSIGVAGGGLVVAIVGIYYLARANPLSDDEVYALATSYNTKLRAKHGLPAARLLPYATGEGGGLALTGRF